MGEINRDIDPRMDAAGVLSNECFLCGRRDCDHTFGQSSKGSVDILPQLAVHRLCILAHLLPNGNVSQWAAQEYHRRISDTVNVKRVF